MKSKLKLIPAMHQRQNKRITNKLALEAVEATQPQPDPALVNAAFVKGNVCTKMATANSFCVPPRHIIGILLAMLATIVYVGRCESNLQGRVLRRNISDSFESTEKPKIMKRRRSRANLSIRFGERGGIGLVVRHLAFLVARIAPNETSAVRLRKPVALHSRRLKEAARADRTSNIFANWTLKCSDAVNFVLAYGFGSRISLTICRSCSPGPASSNRNTCSLL